MSLPMADYSRDARCAFINSIDNYKTETIRETKHYIGIDNTTELYVLYPFIQRSPFILPVATTSQFVDGVLTIDCVARVDYVNPMLTVVWVNIQTSNDVDVRPLPLRSGIFGTQYSHYPVPISIADEIVGSVVFNMNLKITSVERPHFNLTYGGKTYVPYIVNFAI